MQFALHKSIHEIAAADWNSLAGSQPFVQHAFLAALEDTGCTTAESGWQACHASLHHGGKLIAALPLYAKSHSYGEYVFDWAWADASHRAGIRYYPKLVSAVPFTPVPGHRLLAVNEDIARTLLDCLFDWLPASGASGLHCLFPDQSECDIWLSQGLMQRFGTQFHWHNRGYASYGAFLDAMTSEKRKKLRQERRKVSDAGVIIDRKSGLDISDADWAFFSRCYHQTYREHHSTPYLNLDFFRTIGRVLPDACMLAIASIEGQAIASSLCLRDEERLYGRYWGALQYVPSLHFEMCYHQGIEYAIETGLKIFEGGAQGEHKLARGFEAVQTSSFHWLAEPALSSAVDHFLTREREGVTAYISELEDRAPFRPGQNQVPENN